MPRRRPDVEVLGISGWSGCGKTTLIAALIPRLRARGLRVSTLKHAHHDVDLDTPGKDTWRHRAAGAHETMLATGRRWALLRELREEPEPPLAELLTHLRPVDLVLVEGWKTEDYPKLEIWRPMGEDKPPRFPDDPRIIAVASAPLVDPARHGRPGLPALPLNDVEAIARFVIGFIEQSARQSVLLRPARDIYHDVVVAALVKDGWRITHDPLRLTYGGKDMDVDLGAERLLAAEKANRKIAFEIKSFVGHSEMDDLEKALGQYVLYRAMLAEREPDRELYLAVPRDVMKLFEQPLGKLLRRNGLVRAMGFDPNTVVITQWIP